MAALLILALAPLAAAEAKAPPKGTYTCTFYNPSFGSQFAGTLRILSKGRYTVNKGKKGKFTTKGKKIRFKTGDYKGVWRGKWRKTRGNPVVIGLFQLDDKKLEDEATTCSRSK